MRGKAKALREAHRRGRRAASCRLTLDAAEGACFGSREETQITEVAAQKGTLWNGGFKKKFLRILFFFLKNFKMKRKSVFLLVHTMAPLKLLFSKKFDFRFLKTKILI